MTSSRALARSRTASFLRSGTWIAVSSPVLNRRAREIASPIYAECGGHIYLGESIEFDGDVYPLAGFFPVRFGMSKKQQAHGYAIFEVDRENPFYEKGTKIIGPEFRYSTILERPGKSEELTLKMKREWAFLKDVKD